MSKSTAIAFKSTPAFTICFTSTKPLAKTMAFGGVAMGSIKAQLLAMVTGMSKYRIGTPRPIAIPATTGAKTATKATLLISSVINSISMINKLAVAVTLKFPAAMAPETASTIPDTDIPFANAKPPPNKMSMPQANF